LCDRSENHGPAAVAPRIAPPARRYRFDRNHGPAKRLADGYFVGRCCEGGVVRLPHVLELASVAAGDVHNGEGCDQRLDLRGIDP